MRSRTGPGAERTGKKGFQLRPFLEDNPVLSKGYHRHLRKKIFRGPLSAGLGAAFSAPMDRGEMGGGMGSDSVKSKPSSFQKTPMMRNQAQSRRDSCPTEAGKPFQTCPFLAANRDLSTLYGGEPRQKKFSFPHPPGRRPVSLPEFRRQSVGFAILKTCGPPFRLRALTLRSIPVSMFASQPAPRLGDLRMST